MVMGLVGLVGCRMQMRGTLSIVGTNAARSYMEGDGRPGRCSVVTDDDTDKPWRGYRSAGAVACLNPSPQPTCREPGSGGGRLDPVPWLG